MSMLNPYAKSFIPIKQQQTKKKNEPSSSLNVGNMFNTPENYYKSSINDSQYKFKTKTSRGKQKIFNAKTNRWVLDNSSNRKRISQSNIKTKKKVTFANKPIIEEVIIEESPELITPEHSEGITLELCSRYSRNPTIDLNLIKSTSRPPKNLFINVNQSMKNDIPGYLEYDGIPLNNIQYISRGSFGTVFKYSNHPNKLPNGWRSVKSKSTGDTYFVNDESGKPQWNKPIDTTKKYYEIAVKTYNDPQDTEIALINELNKVKKISNQLPCNLINSKIINVKLPNKSKKNVSVMDLMDGTLSDLVVCPIQDKINILLRLCEHLLCIKKITGNLYYTDLKVGNVLYKCYKNRKVKIVIGDIGGLCTYPEQRGSSTYPPPETLHSGSNCNEGTVVWDIGVTFLELLGYDTTKLFYWKPARNYNQAEFSFKCIEELTKITLNYNLDNIIVKGDTSISMILLKMLDPNPNDRINLIELINALKNGLPKLDSIKNRESDGIDSDYE